MDNDLVHRDIPSPSEWMRARHPDLFSDTRVDDTPRLPKAVFEYHLETLTSRKQEYEFEHFCRKLAEKEICPNLLVQTGPTGGGDSKVDTETYPVAEEIAERWWVGSPSAGAERWAFAFSAKKTWQSKVAADVDKILSTNRDYKRIYFLTNQFVSDKKRSAQEDALSKHAGLPVHIALRLAIITGLSKQNPSEYAVAVGLNLPHGREYEVKTFISVSRINRMAPPSTTNLDTFIAAYQRAGAFILAPAELGTGVPIPFAQLAITKRHVHIRQAWQIGENDPDLSVLDDDDEPIVPAEVVDPPVNRALMRIRAISRGNRHWQ